MLRIRLRERGRATGGISVAVISSLLDAGGGMRGRATGNILKLAASVIPSSIMQEWCVVGGTRELGGMVFDIV
jgi:hypothetical protein